MLKEYASEYKNKTVGFVGMGVSNLPVLKLFLSAGANCVVRDKNDLTSCDFYPELASNGVEFITGDGYLDNITESLFNQEMDVIIDILKGDLKLMKVDIKLCGWDFLCFFRPLLCLPHILQQILPGFTF